MSEATSYLFVPGNRPERFDKALSCGADVVIIDLEDAVPEQDKPFARDEARHWLDWHSAQRTGTLEAGRIVVRINAVASPCIENDLELLRSAPPVGVMLAKAESAMQIEQVVSAVDSNGRKLPFLIPLVETATGIVSIREIVSAPRVQRIAFGTHDYIAELRLSGDKRGLLVPASQIAVASKAAGIGTPIGGVTTDISSGERFREDLDFDRACGFGAKLCIHPAQVGMLHVAMAPSEQEVQWAQRVLAASSAEGGAVRVDGAMVDRPVILKAQAIVARAAKAASQH
jgi:citrate lyase subunit beta / citryl-CoA lyase